MYVNLVRIYFAETENSCWNQQITSWYVKTVSGRKKFSSCVHHPQYCFFSKFRSVDCLETHKRSFKCNNKAKCQKCGAIVSLISIQNRQHFKTCGRHWCSICRTLRKNGHNTIHFISNYKKPVRLETSKCIVLYWGKYTSSWMSSGRLHIHYYI